MSRRRRWSSRLKNATEAPGRSMHSCCTNTETCEGVFTGENSRVVDSAHDDVKRSQSFVQGHKTNKIKNTNRF